MLRRIPLLIGVFSVVFAATYFVALASARPARVAASCELSGEAYPPALGAHTELDTATGSLNETTQYANRAFIARQYIVFLTMPPWWSQTEPAGTHVDQYYDGGHNNYDDANGGLINNTDGSATGWYLFGYYAC